MLGKSRTQTNMIPYFFIESIYSRFTSLAAMSLAEHGNYLLFVTASDAMLR